MNKVDFEQPTFNFIKVNILGIEEFENKINSQLIITIPNNKMVFYKDENAFKSNLSFNIIVNDVNNNIVIATQNRKLLPYALIAACTFIIDVNGRTVHTALLTRN